MSISHVYSKTRTINKRYGTFYGPYSHIGSMYAILDIIKKVYKPRTCRFPITKEGIEQGKYKPCLEYHLHKLWSSMYQQAEL